VLSERWVCNLDVLVKLSQRNSSDFIIHGKNTKSVVEPMAVVKLLGKLVRVGKYLSKVKETPWILTDSQSRSYIYYCLNLD
jgi:hypothetical protein